ncbi:MAG TPA: hypothetical protein VF773_08720 [Verrucomicrobiae bacterium]
MNRIKFFKRRQFVLGPRFLEIEGWRKTEISKELLLTTHPDLPVHFASTSKCRLALLGYAIDPFSSDSEEALLTRMSNHVQTTLDIVPYLDSLTGRFVLIASLPGGDCVYHDAVALRQVQYCQDPSGRTWCGSQAETLADHLGFELDQEILDYKTLPAFQNGKSEFWLLNNRTPYREILNLLPNHYLDLDHCKAVRYWPRKDCIPKLSIEQSIDLCTPMLVNSIRRASERFDLRMGISAGIDSRKTLACTRGFSEKISYFSHGITKDTLEVSDVTIPAALLRKLNIKHHALPLKAMSGEFRELFEASSTWAREKKGNNAYTILEAFGPEITVLNSNISEVAQCIYWLPKSQITGEGLALLTGLCHPFAINEFQKWLDAAQGACAESGFDVLALFFLEQRMGRWATAAFSEYDIAHETFNPYNNRRLHCHMLGVSKSHRFDRRWKVSLRHIKSLWPEVLNEPINPQDSRWAKIQQYCRRFIVHKLVPHWLPIYPYLRFLKRRKRFQRQLRSASLEKTLR